MLPAMHTERHPNLFTKLPTKIPDTSFNPHNNEPTHDTVPLLDSKYSTKWGKGTPKPLTIPST